MQVFLSYSTTDLKQTLEIRDYLESNQISCWIAKRNIPGGTDYAIEIPKAIDQCDFFLLILTASSQKSQFVRNELEWAIKKNKKIIPFMLHEFNLDRPIEFHLQHHQRINVYEVGDVSAKKSLLQILQSTSYVTNTQNILQTNSELNSTDSQNNHPLIKNHHPPKFTQEHPRHGVKITDVVSCPTCTSCILKNTSRHHLLSRCSDTLEQTACAIIGMGIYIIPALVILCLLGLFDKEMIQSFLWNLPVAGPLLFAEKTTWEITTEIIIIMLSIYFALRILEKIIRAHSSNLYRKAFDGDSIYVRHRCNKCREKFIIKIPKKEAHKYL